MNNLDKKYIALLQDILDNGVEKKDRTGTGTLSVFGTQIRHKMSDGFPLLTTKKMYFKGIVTELLWFLRGDTNIKFLVDNDCNIWNGDAYKNFEKRYYKEIFNYETGSHNRLMSLDEFILNIKTDDEFAKKWGELGPIYGKQWRDWGGEFSLHIGLERDGSQDIINFKKGIDQIANLINDLKTNPDSRRLMVSALNVGELDQMVLPPCHYGFQVYTRELSDKERIEWMGGKIQEKYPALVEQQIKHCDEHNVPKRAISLMFNMRSTDVPLGLPFNLASYGLLLEIIAKEVNMVPDELIGNLGDTHIYLNQIEGIKEQLTREPFDLPKVLKKDEYHYLADMDIPFSEKIDAFKPDFWKLENYQSHPFIKIPLSN
jgi:thymidylate synthase